MKIRTIYTFLLFIAFSLKLYAQPHIDVTDSIAIEKYRYRLNREFIADELGKKDRNNHAVIDSLINGSHTRYNEGSVSYSPDKKFKIFVLTGESCGGNCSYINAAYVYLIKERKSIPVDLFPVEKIFKLDNEKYLVLQEGLTDGGIYLSVVRAATLLSIKNGNIIFHQISYIYPGGRFNTVDKKINRSLRLQQYEDIDDNNNLASNKFILRFDPETRDMTYSYIFDSDHINGNSADLYSGYFHYENGAFIHKKEKRIKYKKNH